MKLQQIEISAEEMDYLSQKYEIREHKDIFVWAVKLLHDIAKLDEDDWCLSFQKCKIDMDSKKVEYLKYNPVHYKLEYLTPTKEGWPRLQKPEFFNQSQKINE